MATSVGSVHSSSDLVKDYVCFACEGKHLEESADYFCETCKKFFCRKCIYQHDQFYTNHSKYGREETNKWPLTKKIEDLLLKCDVHKDKNLEMFCEDHSQLCCTHCDLLNHRQCTNVKLISESVNKMSVDMQQLSSDLQTILDELNKFKSSQDESIKSVEVSYSEKLQEIRNQRKKLNAALDALENTTLAELNELRTTLQAALKKDVDNCNRLKDELKQLRETVQGLCDKSKKELEFIASRICLDKIQESESYLKHNSVKMQSSIIFEANIDIEKNLSQQANLGRIVESMQSLTLNMNPDQVLTVKSKSEYSVRISSDTNQTFGIKDICCLPSGQVIVIDVYTKVKLLDQHYNETSHCDVTGNLYSICQITSSEVAVTVDSAVQFISVSNGQLVNGGKFQLQHAAFGIGHHQGALYITSGTALYHYTLTGSLVKKLYEDASDSHTVYGCAVSPAGDRIYVTNFTQHKLITLATDGTLISTFTDPELQNPWGVHVTPSGQVLVCGYSSHTVIQVDREGSKRLATLISNKDGVINPISVYYNTNNHQILVGLYSNDKIKVWELQ
ncbi:uncharacterized protein LOC127861855 [Dreissena polymorpha]|uniref:uncharacterized protein LOC127861855 n=1 Tax=Dreissena polymorpha TaxID=45954 RepID=UPI0022646561|nr:uncharacterized protein LOC127861855 [Dreissena polymorpha]